MQTNLTTRMSEDGKKVSTMNICVHRMTMRAETINHIPRSCQLFCQFMIDMYAKTESERLVFVGLNQKNLKVNEYIHFRDAIDNDENAINLGQLVILPATFIGSSCHVHEYTQDTMIYIRNYGRSDLFVTFICNPR